ncbi:anoctamin [Thraustotheca clavata]|uniref:Anoctamin n=1 Tax=Thraustotheca clavata TaxID=74557 RepID=A0A1V9ZCB4_9STRA|nr:anoctamin [Thraustotheca clavata]
MIDKQLGAISSHSIRMEGDEWAFVIVFPNQDVETLKLKLISLLKAGLILKMFYSNTKKLNSSEPSMIFCKVRAKLEALKSEAARINLPMLMNKKRLEEMARIGIKHDDDTVSTFVIGDDKTLRHDKLTPYEYIYMKYDRKYKEVESLYQLGPNGEVFTSVERLILIESIITNVAKFDIDKLKNEKVIEDCFPLHNTDDLIELKSKWTAWMRCHVFCLSWILHDIPSCFWPCWIVNLCP